MPRPCFFFDDNHCAFVDIPLKNLEKNIHLVREEQEKKNSANPAKVPIFTICRLGNDSQLAINVLRDKLDVLDAKDIIGGYRQWSLQIDDTFPKY
jgi:adenylyltransferase/sulfurtransferase